jgi:hypothetical protein
MAKGRAQQDEDPDEGVDEMVVEFHMIVQNTLRRPNHASAHKTTF